MLQVINTGKQLQIYREIEKTETTSNTAPEKFPINCINVVRLLQNVLHV